MYPSSWQKRGAGNKQLWGLNFWRRLKYFFRGLTLRVMGDKLLGWQVYFSTQMHIHITVASLWEALESGRTDTPVDSILGISQCHINRKVIFARYLLGWQEWLIKEPRKQNKTGGKMISKKFIKKGGKYRKKGKYGKKVALEALCQVWLNSVVHN